MGNNKDNQERFLSWMKSQNPEYELSKELEKGLRILHKKGRFNLFSYDSCQDIDNDFQGARRKAKDGGLSYDSDIAVQELCELYKTWLSLPPQETVEETVDPKENEPLASPSAEPSTQVSAPVATPTSRTTEEAESVFTKGEKADTYQPIIDLGKKAEFLAASIFGAEAQKKASRHEPAPEPMVIDFIRGEYSSLEKHLEPHRLPSFYRDESTERFFVCDEYGIYPDRRIYSGLTPFLQSSGFEIKQTAPVLTEVVNTLARPRKGRYNDLAVLPDALDDFLVDIRRALLVGDTSLLFVPSSVAIVFALLRQNKLDTSRPQEFFITDFDAHKPCRVRFLYDPKGKPKLQWVGPELVPNIRPYWQFERDYVVHYSETNNLDWNDELIDYLVESGEFEAIRSSKGGLLLSHEETLSVFSYDPQMENVVADFLEQIHSYKALPNEFIFSSLLNSCDPKMVLRGAEEISRRLESGEELWAIHLPNLRLKVTDSTSHLSYITLIGQKNQVQDIRETWNLIREFRVDQHFAIPAQQNEVSLPLESDVKISGQNKAALFRVNPSLSKDLEVRFIVRYSYGAEEPYDLFAVPVDKDNAPFAKLQNTWVENKPYKPKNPDFEASNITARDNVFSYLNADLSRANRNIGRVLRDSSFVRREDCIEFDPTGRFKIWNGFGALNKQAHYSLLYTFSRQGTKKVLEKNVALLSEALSFVRAYSKIQLIGNNSAEWRVFAKNYVRLIAKLSTLGSVWIRSHLDIQQNEITAMNEIIKTQGSAEDMLFFSRSFMTTKEGKDFIKPILNSVKGMTSKDRKSFLRSFGSICFYEDQYLQNIYAAEGGPDLIHILADDARYSLINFTPSIIGGKFKPTLLRDLVETALALIQIREYDDTIFNPNEDATQKCIESLSRIDAKLKGVIYDGEYGFGERLKVHDQQKSGWNVPLLETLKRAIEGRETILMKFVGDKQLL